MQWPWPSQVSGLSQTVSPWLPQVLPERSKQLSVASLQVSAHSVPPVHGSPAWTQAPPLQVSVPLQNNPSLHDAVLFGLEQPTPAVQTSFVQTFPSLQAALFAVATQFPAAQESFVHAIPSLHVLVLSLALTHEPFEQTSSVHGLPSVQVFVLSAVPRQAPFLH